MKHLSQKRIQILQQMEQITAMENGSIQSESRPSKSDPSLVSGPYFKHQVWEDGVNVTRRVSPEEAERLAKAVEGRKQFEFLAQEFKDTTIEMTRAQLPASAQKKTAPISKRRSSRKPKRSSTAS